MQRGDVVQLDWPFSDQSGSKFRPAVVVQADYLDAIIADTILVRITSKIHGITGTEVILFGSIFSVQKAEGQFIGACFAITASADLNPSTAALTMPPA